MTLPDFDELVRLAKEDPEALERIRQEAVENLINKAPLEKQRRLRGLQFQIDMERKKAKNPMDACVKVSRMMHDSFCTLRDKLNEAQQTHMTQLKSILSKSKEKEAPKPQTSKKTSATVLKLTPKGD